MKIKKQLPQFDDAVALLMVLGGKEGVFYLAHEGEIRKAGGCRVNDPKYSDNEGFFGKRSRGGATAAGSVREYPKQQVEAEFLKACKAEASRIEKEQGFNEVYLFVPARLKNSLQETLPVRIKKKIQKVKTGNHHEKHPFEILEMLQVKR